MDVKHIIWCALFNSQDVEFAVEFHVSLLHGITCQRWILNLVGYCTTVVHIPRSKVNAFDHGGVTLEIRDTETNHSSIGAIMFQAYWFMGPC
jgi:hypothetical protein